ncbi:MAG: phosphate acetyltransferase, partial [Muribaculaceae bacterium]|nr:phosphate acetyltransferase [Muribaculaceae bacterium]
MKLIDQMTERARACRQRIVLPEGLEPRTLTAADRILADELADLVLIGNPKDIRQLAVELKLTNIDKATIIDPADESVIDRYA